MAQRELARHCASTALASVMHHHVVLFTAWRYRRGMPGAEATLRRVADEGIVLVSTGGADLTHPRGTAARVEGGYSGQRAQDLRQPVAGGGGDVDHVPLRRPRGGPHRAEHGRPHSRRRRHGARDLGRPGHARDRQPRHRAAATCSCPTSRSWPAGPTARSTAPLQVILSIAMPADRRGLPRRGRGRPRPRRRARRRHAARPTTRASAPGRTDGHPPAGRRLGPRRRPGHRRRRPAPRRWTPSSP